jgi:hypothetical protein
VRLAYADPPYPGQAKRHYADHPDYAGEVDHAELIEKLAEYDAWALSTSSTSLKDVLALCPAGVRVGAWVKPFAAFKAQAVTFAWEPVVYVPRKQKFSAGDMVQFDWVSATPPVFHNKRTGVAGTKPDLFCFWLFRLLGAEPSDTLNDLFPGSGAVSSAWETFTRQGSLVAVNERDAIDVFLRDCLPLDGCT